MLDTSAAAPQMVRPLTTVLASGDVVVDGCEKNGSPFADSTRTRPRVQLDPLEIFREGLALARRAGMPWQQAQYPAREAALSVAPDDDERDEWDIALYDTRTAWMRAYERRPTDCKL
jgi:hypothetical protein